MQTFNVYILEQVKQLLKSSVEVGWDTTEQWLLSATRKLKEWQETKNLAFSSGISFFFFEIYKRDLLGARSMPFSTHITHYGPHMLSILWPGSPQWKGSTYSPPGNCAGDSSVVQALETITCPDLQSLISTILNWSSV